MEISIAKFDSMEIQIEMLENENKNLKRLLEESRNICRTKSKKITEICQNALYERDIDIKQYYLEEIIKVAIKEEGFKQLVECMQDEWDKSKKPNE